MKLKTLTNSEFDEFSSNHPLGNYLQSSNYAELASKEGYEYDLLGLLDDDNNIQAASLILNKKIGLFNRYGYAPKGFLLNYYDTDIITEFTNKLKNYYSKKNLIFIKINPEISIGEMDYKNQSISYNKNQMIDGILKGFNFRKFENNKRFESKLPHYNAIQVLKNTNLNTISKNTRNKIKKSIKNGLTIKKGTRDDIEILYNFIKNKKNHPINHYYNYYDAFNDSVDLFLVEINFDDCLINLREKYEQEFENNKSITEKLKVAPSKSLQTKKAVSDKALETYRDNIAEATKHLAVNKKAYIAGALTIRYKNRVYIIISGFDQRYRNFCPNYYLHYQLIEYYKKDYDYLDLNGITGDFTTNNPYKGLDQFKLGFNPLTFEYIGEYDFIINENVYQSMIQSGQLAKEFNRKIKSINEN